MGYAHYDLMILNADGKFMITLLTWQSSDNSCDVEVFGMTKMIPSGEGYWVHMIHVKQHKLHFKNAFKKEKKRESHKWMEDYSWPDWMWDWLTFK